MNSACSLARSVFCRILPAALAGSAIVLGGIALWRLSAYPLEWHARRPEFLLFAALLATGGLVSAILLAALARLHRRNAATAERERGLAVERDRFLQKIYELNTKIDGLVTVREIHRTVNLGSRVERIRRILTAIATLAEAEEIALFTAERTGIRPAAYLRGGARAELFLYFDRDPGEGSRWRTRGVTATSAAGRLVIRGVLTAAARGRGRARDVGSLELSADTPTLPEAGAPDPTAILSWYLAHAARGTLRAGGRLAEIPGHGRGFRVEDARSDGVDIVFPLLTAGGIIGALSIRLSGPAVEKIPSIEAVLEESAAHLALALREERSRERAKRDGLTGFLVRRYLLPDLSEAVGRARKGRRKGERALSFLLLDVDHFKAVNDRYGHQTGDAVLREIARAARKSLRGGVKAYRYGGEEFAVVIPGASLPQALRAAERIRRAVERARFRSEAGEELPVTVSVGVAELDGVPGPEELISRADRALYAAKEAGRNRVIAWSVDLAVRKS